MTVQALPAGASQEPSHRRKGLQYWVRVAILLVPAFALLLLLVRVVFPAPGAGAVRTSGGYFQFLLQGTSIPLQTIEFSRVASRPGVPWPARTPAALSVFVEDELPSEVIDDFARREGVPLAFAAHRDAADLVVGRTQHGRTAPAVDVTTGGQVQLTVPAARAPAVAGALEEVLRGPLDADGRPVLVLGHVDLYLRPEVQAVKEARVRERGRRRPAPERRWTPLPLLLDVEPEARVVPALQVVRPGEEFQLDFQVRGYDREWYSVANRAETSFRALSGGELVRSNEFQKGRFVIPADALADSPEGRVVIEARLEGPGGRGLTSRALVVILPDEWH